MKNIFFFKIAICSMLILVCNVNQSSGQTYEIIATNLPGINGMSLDSEGNLWIIQPGIEKEGGCVKVITSDKKIYTAITGLPVYFDWERKTQPACKVYKFGISLKVITGGIKQVDAGLLITFDIKNWKPGDHPLTFNDAKNINHISDFALSHGFKASDPYRVVWDAQGNAIIADAGANAILKNDAKSDQFSILHSFSPIPNSSDGSSALIDYAPTGIVKNPAGGYYVCNQTGYPFINGKSSIMKMDERGEIAPFVDGLSLLADLDIDAQGNLYALQLGQFDSLLNPVPFEAKVSKISPDGQINTYASGFTAQLSSGIVYDGTGGFYVNDFILGNILHVRFPFAKEAQNYNEKIELKVSPNPVNSKLNLEFNLMDSSDVLIAIYNTKGQQVYSQNLGMLTKGIHALSINLKLDSYDQFTLQLITKDGIGIKKIIKG